MKNVTLVTQRKPKWKFQRSVSVAIALLCSMIINFGHLNTPNGMLSVLIVLYYIQFLICNVRNGL